MKYKIILLMFFTLAYSDSFEIDFGYQNPQGVYDKYSEPGFSFRLTYSKEDNLFPYIRYDFSYQYLKFKSDYWTEYTPSNFPVSYTHSEESYGFLIGPRLMSPTKRGAFRPYIGAKAGIFFFTEKVKAELGYNWGDSSSLLECIIWEFIDSLDDEDDGDCDPDTSYTQVQELKPHLGMILEMGSNFNISNSWGMDFGMQYNIIPTIRPQYEYEEEQEDEQGNISLIINEISKSINADYLTFYIGFNFNIEGDK